MTFYLIVALGRPAGNTSLPTGRQATPWNAGFVGIGWIIEDFTKSEVQQRHWTVVLDVEDVPPQGFFQCPRRVCQGDFFATLRFIISEKKTRAHHKQTSSFRGGQKLSEAETILPSGLREENPLTALLLFSSKTRSSSASNLSFSRALVTL
jgi:hypothetical protein